MKYSEMFVGYGPADEKRPSLVASGEHAWSFLECRAYLAQLHRLFGPPPSGAKLSIRTHDESRGGWWYCVVCRFDTAHRDAATEYVSKLLEQAPSRWDAPAREELELDVARPAPAANGHAKNGKPSTRSNGKPGGKTPVRVVRHKSAPKVARKATQEPTTPASRKGRRAGKSPAAAGKGAGHAA